MNKETCKFNIKARIKLGKGGRKRTRDDKISTGSDRERADIFYARCTWNHRKPCARVKPVQRHTRQEMAPTFAARRQSSHRLPGYEGPADGRNHRRHCGRHSCRALFSSEQRRRHRERTTTHAKAIIKRRCPTGFYLLSLSLSLFFSLSARVAPACQLQLSTSHWGSVQCFFSRRVDDPVRIVPRQEIRPTIVPSPNAPTVTRLFRLFTSSDVDGTERVLLPILVEIFSRGEKWCRWRTFRERVNGGKIRVSRKIGEFTS